MFLRTSSFEVLCFVVSSFFSHRPLKFTALLIFVLKIFEMHSFLDHRPLKFPHLYILVEHRYEHRAFCIWCVGLVKCWMDDLRVLNLRVLSVLSFKSHHICSISIQVHVEKTDTEPW